MTFTANFFGVQNTTDLLVGASQPLSTLTTYPDLEIGYPDINDTGTIATVESGIRITTFDPSGAHVLVPSGTFGNIDVLLGIDAAGDVAFTADLPNGTGRGLFVVDSSGEIQPVVMIGDTLGGATVLTVSFYRNGFNDLGQIAFAATLSDGTQVIERADPDASPMRQSQYRAHQFPP
jgi:hypothetical protein